MIIMGVTEWASYLVPEEELPEFNKTVELYKMMDMPIWVKEIEFDKIWGDYKIVVA